MTAMTGTRLSGAASAASRHPVQTEIFKYLATDLDSFDRVFTDLVTLRVLCGWWCGDH